MQEDLSERNEKPIHLSFPDEQAFLDFGDLLRSEKIPFDQFPFQVLCITTRDWHHLVDKYYSNTELSFIREIEVLKDTNIGTTELPDKEEASRQAALLIMEIEEFKKAW